MSILSCPDCVHFDERVVALQARIAELEAAAIRNDERHAEAITAVRRRAEHAEARIESMKSTMRSAAKVLRENTSALIVDQIATTLDGATASVGASPNATGEPCTCSPRGAVHEWFCKAVLRTSEAWTPPHPKDTIMCRHVPIGHVMCDRCKAYWAEQATPGHTCNADGGAVFDLRCRGGVQLRIATEGALLPVGEHRTNEAKPEMFAPSDDPKTRSQLTTILALRKMNEEIAAQRPDKPLPHEAASGVCDKCLCACDCCTDRVRGRLVPRAETAEPGSGSLAERFDTWVETHGRYEDRELWREVRIGLYDWLGLPSPTGSTER